MLRTCKYAGLSPQIAAAAAAAEVVSAADAVGRRGRVRASARRHVRDYVLRLMGAITILIPLQKKDGRRKVTRGASRAKRKVMSPAIVSALPLAVASCLTVSSSAAARTGAYNVSLKVNTIWDMHEISVSSSEESSCVETQLFALHNLI